MRVSRTLPALLLVLATLANAETAVALPPLVSIGRNVGVYLSEAQFKAFSDHVQETLCLGSDGGRMEGEIWFDFSELGAGAWTPLGMWEKADLISVTDQEIPITSITDNTIPNPSPLLTKAVNDVTSTAGRGPVDVGAVEYLVNRLNEAIPAGDPSFAPLSDAASQLGNAVTATMHTEPVGSPKPFTTVTFGSQSPAATVTTDVVVTTTVQSVSWVTTTVGTATTSVAVTTVSNVITTTRKPATPTGGSVTTGTAGATATPSLSLPFQPQQQNAAVGDRPVVEGLAATGVAVMLALLVMAY
ncbi:uncharacterized protein EV422DRAFT_503259 [Fimicolochytrium jonesii]|uniref:uncharacterized protein n=1 Tax=Fimicolochytrium jonesii TaxID=1396493 RepID=UPI0022FE81FF|nr:uncharacterized protein EV422DRAFT_503259 [Fimicolochytrium jonesii]KAI8825904.1 hypothetical protein EV422DRAFT_503259 [Fimicolochytrium jonesii]